MKKKIVIAIGVLVVGLQLFRGSPPEVSNQNPDDLIAVADLSPEISGILKSACYDCHSNESNYPWYTYITPISWWVFHHVEEGREELNFSEWASMEKRRKIRKLKEIREEVEEGEMPLNSYTIAHREAKLSEEEKQLILDWAEAFTAQVLEE